MTTKLDIHSRSLVLDGREFGAAGAYEKIAGVLRFETDPGVQTQVDWAILGTWPVDGEPAELSAMVAILGCSRAPAIRFATDRTRLTSLARVTRCLDDLGGVTREVLLPLVQGMRRQAR